ncbi:MAG: DASS family sodium-coupled anion symporter [Deltaproteobacteria bacterium]|nr:DASS family sodium-coupled anion symporter [Deltaproteobacteria bacterium]
MTVEIDRRPIWFLLFLRFRRPLFFAAIALVFLYVVATPASDGLSEAGKDAMAIFLLCLILWVSNAIPPAVTGLFAIVLVPLLGVLPKKDAYALFGNEAVFFILGAFILAAAIMRTGLSNRIALTIMKKTGSTPKRLLLSVFFLAAVLSFFMSEHAVAAMLFPTVLAIANGLGLRPGASNYGKLLFLSLAWGCVIGGVATFLGGARVPLAVGMLKESTGETIGFLSYTIAVFPLVMIMMGFAVFLLPRLFPIDIEGVDKAREILSKRIKTMGKVSTNEYAVGVVLVLTVAAWMMLGHTAGLANIALISVVVLFVLKVVSWKDIEEYVNWGVVLMYGGAITLGVALDRSGAAAWLAYAAIGEWAGSPWMVIAFFSFLTLVLTECMSNAAVIAVLLPIGIGLAERFAMSPMLITYAIAIPAGLAFALPMATPANAIAASSNYITVSDLMKGGVIMTVVSWIVIMLVAAFWWPLIGIGG